MRRAQGHGDGVHLKLPILKSAGVALVAIPEGSPEVQGEATMDFATPEIRTPLIIASGRSWLLAQPGTLDGKPASRDAQHENPHLIKSMN